MHLINKEAPQQNCQSPNSSDHSWQCASILNWGAQLQWGKGPPVSRSTCPWTLFQGPEVTNILATLSSLTYPHTASLPMLLGALLLLRPGFSGLLGGLLGCGWPWFLWATCLVLLVTPLGGALGLLSPLAPVGSSSLAALALLASRLISMLSIFITVKPRALS